MRKCAICLKQNRRNGPFFQVPIEERKRQIWSKSCGIALQPNDRVCGDHFAKTHLIIGSKKTNLMPIAVPFPKVTTPSPDEHMSHMPFYSQVETTYEIPKCKDGQTQTDSIVLECFKDVEIAALKKEIKSLKAENDQLKLQLLKSNAIWTNMRPFFTEGQYRKLLIPERKIRWTWDDISSAICLHAAGPRAYNHLYKKGFPVPHSSTLLRWYRTLQINEGILTVAIDLMRQNADLSNDEKICVLSFDEMKLAEAFECDQEADPLRELSSNYVQVAMARGLKNSWKQTVFSEFDCQMTADILGKIISALNKAGFPVVAIVCDMSSTNGKLWKSLGVTSEKPWFANPSKEDEKVFVFADPPHLLKLIKNYFLDTGLVWNGQILTKRTICDLLKHQSDPDTPITSKLTAEHLSVKGISWQKVSLAAQIFSNTTANAIRRCHSIGKEIYKPLEAADMIQLVNDWFDVLNSTMLTSHYGKEPYGLKLIKQERVICRMNEFMSAPISPGRKDLEFFQKGVLMTNAALVMLHEYVKTKYNMEYILTNRLSQDVLKNFFAAMCSKDGLNDHPTPKEFKCRLRKYILARNTEHLQGTSNVENDPTEWLSNSNQQHLGAGYSGDYKGISTLDILLDSEVEQEADIFSEPHSEALKDFGVLHEDSLEHISGDSERQQTLCVCDDDMGENNDDEQNEDEYENTLSEEMDPRSLLTFMDNESLGSRLAGC